MAASLMPNDEDYKDLGRGLARLEERLDGLAKLFDRSFDRLERTIEELADRFNGDVDQFRGQMNGLTDITRRVIELEAKAKEAHAEVKDICAEVEELQRLAAQSKVLRWAVNIGAAAGAGALVRAIWH